MHLYKMAGYSEPHGYIYLRHDTNVPGRYKVGKTTQLKKRGQCADLKGTEPIMVLPVWGTAETLARHESDIIQNLAMKFQTDPGKNEWFRGDPEAMVTEIINHRISMQQLVIPGTPRPSHNTRRDDFDYEFATADRRSMLQTLYRQGGTMRDFIKMLLFVHPTTGKLFWYNHKQGASFCTHVTVDFLHMVYGMVMKVVMSRPDFTHLLCREAVINTIQYMSDGQKPFEYKLYLVEDGNHASISTQNQFDATTPCGRDDGPMWTTPPMYNDTQVPVRKTVSIQRSKKNWFMPWMAQHMVPPQYRHLVSAIITADDFISSYYSTENSKIYHEKHKTSGYLPISQSNVPVPVLPLEQPGEIIIMNGRQYYSGATIGISNDYLVSTQVLMGGLPIFLRSDLTPTGMYVVGDTRNSPEPVQKNIIAYKTL